MRRNTFSHEIRVTSWYQPLPSHQKSPEAAFPGGEKRVFSGLVTGACEGLKEIRKGRKQRRTQHSQPGNNEETALGHACQSLPEPRVWSPESGAQSTEYKTQSPEQKAWNPEFRAWNAEFRAQSLEHRTQNLEVRALSPECCVSACKPASTGAL